MLQVSFRLMVCRSFPGFRPCKPAALLALAALLAGCGGSGTSEHTGSQQVRGIGYAFGAPKSWKVARAGRTVSAAHEPELVSVTVFRLARPYRSALWGRAVPALDRVAEQLAAGLHGRLDARETMVLAGRRARRYDVSFARDGKDLVERIAFVLDGRREYELLCRFPHGDAGAGKRCVAFLASFRPA
jgi:hypothetical protein